MEISDLKTLVFSKIPIIQAPTTETYGNCAEEIYFGLLRARGEGRKTIFLFPKDVGSLFMFSKRGTGVNTALADVCSSHRVLNNRNPVVLLLAWCLTIKGCLTLLLNIVLIKSGIGRIRRDSLQPTIGRRRLWNRRAVYGVNCKERYWARELTHKLDVRLTDEVLQTAEKYREKMGLPIDAWYVCLHVREGGYYGWNEGPGKVARNSLIENVIPAVRHIVKLGGWVVRLGDPTMGRLEAYPQVIDYPMTKFKSDIMDVYLVMNCLAYIGGNSGPWDVANMFQKPTIMPNITDFYTGYPWREGSIGIPKKVYCGKSERYLSLKEIVTKSIDETIKFDQNDQYELVENTADEILDLVKEYFELLDNPKPTSEHQKLVHEIRKDGVDRILSKSKWSEVQKNRFVSKLVGFRGVISQKYLANNWEHDSNEK